MFWNYVRVAWRSLLRYKGFAFINVFGLSLGLVTSIFIGLWIHDEWSIDKFHADSDRIMQMMRHSEYKDGIGTSNSVPGILGENLVNDIPEVEYQTQYAWRSDVLFDVGETSIRRYGTSASGDFFNVFSFEVLEGDRNTPFANPDGIAISKSLAEALFGDEPAVGKTLTVNRAEEFRVTAVYADMEANSTMNFDYLISWGNFLASATWATEWGNFGPHCVIKVREGTDLDALNEKLKPYLASKEVKDNEVFAFPFADQYLYGRFMNTREVNGTVVFDLSGRILYVRIFSIVAIAILLLACINYMNLSTSRAMRRAKEVGVRKAIGAQRGELIGQYLGESILITGFALASSFAMMSVALPWFNDLTQKSITLPFAEPGFWVAMVVILGITALVAGSYPALYLSGLNPLKIFRGGVKGSVSEWRFRQVQVVFQFVICLVLIGSAVTFFRQLDYMQTMDSGYDREQLVSLNLISGGLFNADRFDLFARELKNKPGIVDVSRANQAFVGRQANTWGLNWKGKDPDSRYLFETIAVDYDFFKTMDIELVAGRPFSRDFRADSAKVILNEAAIRVMGMENPIGEMFNVWGRDREIIGVAGDFQFQSARNDVEPAWMLLAPNMTSNAYIRIDAEQTQIALAGIESVYNELNPGYPFEYVFQDERFAQVYQSDQQVRNLASSFTVLAVMISCLGLFGLSMFAAEQRKRELGIRKVLGAKVTQLMVTLSKEFTMLVMLSILIAVPVTYWMMDQWLAGYANRVDVNAFILLGTGGFLLAFAWLTISFQTFRATQINPVEVLKSE